MLVIELWAERPGSKEQKHFVRFVYNDKELVLPGAPDAYCPLETFVSLAKELIPVDFERECVTHEAKL